MLKSSTSGQQVRSTQGSSAWRRGTDAGPVRPEGAAPPRCPAGCRSRGRSPTATSTSARVSMLSLPQPEETHRRRTPAAANRRHPPSREHPREHTPPSRTRRARSCAQNALVTAVQGGVESVGDRGQEVPKSGLVSGSRSPSVEVVEASLLTSIVHASGNPGGTRPTRSRRRRRRRRATASRRRHGFGSEWQDDADPRLVFDLGERVWGLVDERTRGHQSSSSISAAITAAAVDDSQDRSVVDDTERASRSAAK